MGSGVDWIGAAVFETRVGPSCSDSSSDDDELASSELSMSIGSGLLDEAWGLASAVVARLTDGALCRRTTMTSEPMLSLDDTRASWSSLSLSSGTSSCNEGECGVFIGVGVGFATVAFGVK